MRGAEPRLDTVDFEEGGKEFFQRPLEVRHRQVFVDRQPLHLMEHRRVGLVVVRAVDTARADDAQRRAFGLHRAYLNGAGVRAQHMGRAVIAFGPVHVERIHFGARRMMAGDVERIEVVPIGVDTGPFGHGKAHFGEDCCQLLGHLADGVDGTVRAAPSGQRHVQPFTPQAFVQRGIGQATFLGGQCRVDLILQGIERGPGNLPFLRRHLAEFAHLQRDFALLSHRCEADILERGLIAGIGYPAQVFLLEIVHHAPLDLCHVLLAPRPCDCKRAHLCAGAALGY